MDFEFDEIDQITDVFTSKEDLCHTCIHCFNGRCPLMKCFQVSSVVATIADFSIKCCGLYQSDDYISEMIA